MGLHKEYKIRSGRAYQFIRAKGRKLFFPSFVMWFYLDSETSRDHHRVGIVASRKVGKAVVRNHQKRRVQSLFWNNRQRIGPRWDIVCNIRARIKDASFGDLEREFEQVLRKLQTLHSAH